jgi:hypothetical protein
VILFILEQFRPRLRRFGDLLSCVDKKVGKQTSPVLVRSCGVKTFLPCPVLIRPPGSAKPGATSLSRSWIYFFKKAFPPRTSTWGLKTPRTKLTHEYYTHYTELAKW